MAALSAWTEAQQAVIGSLLIDPEHAAGEVFGRAKPQHFGDAAMRHVFEAALAVWEDNRPLDPVTVLAEAGNDYYSLLKTCMEVTPTAANVVPWLEICRNCARLSAMQGEALAIINAERADDADAAYERMGELLRGTEDVEDLTMTELIGSYLDRMQDRTPPDYLSWGIDRLDSTLAVSPGKFVIIAADSSVGKTALALQFAYHIASTGKRVGFFSLETDAESLTARLMAEKQVAGIPLPASKAKQLHEDDFRRAGEAGIRSDRVPLRIVRRADTLEAIRARTLMRKFEVIFVDYVQLIDAPGRERWDIVTNISMGLHRMAQQLGVTVVGLSQITPAAKGSKSAPTKDDLRESRQLKQDADAIMILSPSPDEDDPENTRVLEIAKNKDGRCGKFKLRFEPEHMTFTPLVTLTGLRGEGKTQKGRKPTKAGSVPDVKPGELREMPEEDGQEELPF